MGEIKNQGTSIQGAFLVPSRSVLHITATSHSTWGDSQEEIDDLPRYVTEKSIDEVKRES